MNAGLFTMYYCWLSPITILQTNVRCPFPNPDAKIRIDLKKKHCKSFLQ